MEKIRPLTLRVTRRAAAHLISIEDYISADNPPAARSVGARIRQAFETLCHFPDMGRAGRESGTREWVVRGLPYIVVYIAGESTLDILGVFHAARENRNY